LVLLGRAIRIGRAERGLTAQELADRAGVSRTTLSTIEKGSPAPEIGIVFEVALSLVSACSIMTSETLLGRTLHASMTN
jgi:DNA-binding XRE family transcriptional regulator